MKIALRFQAICQQIYVVCGMNTEQCNIKPVS